MTWTDPPTKITEARDRLLECAAVQALFPGLSLVDQQARAHYPEADPLTDDMPLFALSRIDEEYNLSAAGASSGIGEIEAVFHLPLSYSLGQVESLVSVPKQLLWLRTEGLFIIRARATRSTDTNSALEAGEDSTADVGVQFRAITITMNWEG